MSQKKCTSNDLVILFSGGSDSILLVELAKILKRNPICLMIDYGQTHIEELNVAKKYIEKNNLKSHIIKICDLNINSALTGNLKTGEYDNVSVFNVPGRNTIFLSLAFGFAESNKIKEIWYGADYTDREDLFPDTYQEYIYQINKLFLIAGSFPIEVHAPLIGLTKNMVLDILKLQYNIKDDDIFSGYGDI